LQGVDLCRAWIFAGQRAELASRLSYCVTPRAAAAGDGRKFATWDALKHAEGMLIKAQQQAK
jgi:hypothetical protein